MTNPELQTIAERVISTLTTNARKIEGLTPVSTLHDADLFEVSGGRRISFGAIKDIIATEVLPGADFVRVVFAENATEAYEAATAPEIVDDGHITIISWRGKNGKGGVILQTHLGKNLVTQMAPIEGDSGRATKIRAIQLTHDEEGILTNVSVGEWLTTKTIANVRLTEDGVIEYQNAATGYWLTFVDLSPLKEIANTAKSTANLAKTIADTALSTADSAQSTAEAAANAVADLQDALTPAFEVVEFEAVMVPSPSWTENLSASGAKSTDEGCAVDFNPETGLFYLRIGNQLYGNWADVATFGVHESAFGAMGGVRPLEHRIYVASKAKFYVWNGEELVLFADLTDANHHKSAHDAASIRTFNDLWASIGGEYFGNGSESLMSQTKKYKLEGTTMTYAQAIAAFIEHLTSTNSADINELKETVNGIFAPAGLNEQVCEALDDIENLKTGKADKADLPIFELIEFEGVKEPRGGVDFLVWGDYGYVTNSKVYYSPSLNKFYLEADDGSAVEEAVTYYQFDYWEGCDAVGDVELAVYEGAADVRPFVGRIYVDRYGNRYGYNGSVLCPEYANVAPSSSVGYGTTVGDNVTMNNRATLDAFVKSYPATGKLSIRQSINDGDYSGLEHLEVGGNNVIGSNNKIFDNVKIYDNVTIGSNAVIEPLTYAKEFSHLSWDIVNGIAYTKIGFEEPGGGNLYFKFLVGSPMGNYGVTYLRMLVDPDNQSGKFEKDGGLGFFYANAIWENNPQDESERRFDIFLPNGFDGEKIYADLNSLGVKLQKVGSNVSIGNGASVGKNVVIPDGFDGGAVALKADLPNFKPIEFAGIKELDGEVVHNPTCDVNVFNALSDKKIYYSLSEHRFWLKGQKTNGEISRYYFWAAPTNDERYFYNFGQVEWKTQNWEHRIYPFAGRLYKDESGRLYGYDGEDLAPLLSQTGVGTTIGANVTISDNVHIGQAMSISANTSQAAYEFSWPGFNPASIGSSTQIGSSVAIGDFVNIPDGFKLSTPMTVDEYNELEEYDDNMLYLLVSE